MPFNYEEYTEKCSTMSEVELQKEWENYTRQIAGGATSTTLSVGFAHLTMGASLVGLGLSAPRIHNARKKRAIIESHLQALSATHHTRKQDVLGPIALSSTIGGLTLGLAPLGSHEVAALGADHAVNAIVSNPHAVESLTHVAVDGVGASVEEMLDKRTRGKEARKMERAQAVMLRQFQRWKEDEGRVEVGIVRVDGQVQVEQKDDEALCPPALVRAYTDRVQPPAYSENVAVGSSAQEESVVVDEGPTYPEKVLIVVKDKESPNGNNSGKMAEHAEEGLSLEDLKEIFECKVWKEVQDSHDHSTPTIEK